MTCFKKRFSKMNSLLLVEVNLTSVDVSFRMLKNIGNFFKVSVL